MAATVPSGRYVWPGGMPYGYGYPAEVATYGYCCGCGSCVGCAVCCGCCCCCWGWAALGLTGAELFLEGPSEAEETTVGWTVAVGGAWGCVDGGGEEDSDGRMSGPAGW